MGKNGNEHKQWCEELDGDGDEDWWWGFVYINEQNLSFICEVKQQT